MSALGNLEGGKETFTLTHIQCTTWRVLHQFHDFGRERLRPFIIVGSSMLSGGLNGHSNSGVISNCKKIDLINFDN
jgi:hypothetical protein